MVRLNVLAFTCAYKFYELANHIVWVCFISLSLEFEVEIKHLSAEDIALTNIFFFLDSFLIDFTCKYLIPLWISSISICLIECFELALS